MTARARRLVRRAALAGLVLVATAASVIPTASAGVAPGGRLLIVSVPGLTWQEVADQDLPNLEELFATAALADLAPRGVSPRSGPGDAYLTISAGSRATTERLVDGQVLALDEQSSGSLAGEIFTRRTGLTPDGAYVSLTWPTLVRANAREPYDAVLGLLAATLAESGVRTSVLGNADGSDSIRSSYERHVGLALADEDGVVATGALGTDLVRPDPGRPFGQALDADALLQRFTEEWGAAGDDPAVVLVEASDLARSMRYRPLVDAARYRTLREEALADSDALIGDLLAQVDPARDTVLVVAPYNLPGERDLTTVALRTPDGSSGYLKSASTQRSGFLTLVDIAPTILDTFGIERPVDMEGRPAELVASSADLDSRVDHLIALNEASRFRERLLVPTTLLVVVSMALLALAAVVTVVRGQEGRARRWLPYLALADLGLLPMSYLARGFPLEDLGIGFYWAFVVVGALVAALLATVVGRRVARPRVSLAVMLAFVAVVLVGDVMTGSRLSLSAAFGYSPTGNSRLYGISNYSYGMLSAAVCVLAAFLAAREPVRRSRLLAIGLLVATLVVLGVPIWGSDVGGILAFTPTILVFAALVWGRRVRLRTVVAGAAATIAAVTAFGFLDLSRPPEERAHLGRLFERVGDEGLGPLFSIMERKLLANANVSTSSFWVAAIPLAIAFFVFLARYPSRPLAAARTRIPALGAGLAAALVAAVLGSLVNDSGAIVGGVAATVLTVSMIHLVLAPEAAPT